MGREIRRVPANWRHPQEINPRTGKRSHANPKYIPLHDMTLSDWRVECAKWDAGLEVWLIGQAEPQINYAGAKAEWFEGTVTEFQSKLERTGLAYEEWFGARPDIAKSLPYSREEEAWFQLYETTSAGTPLTPAFATSVELIDYLVQFGTFWGESWTRVDAEMFVEPSSALRLNLA